MATEQRNTISQEELARRCAEAAEAGRLAYKEGRHGAPGLDATYRRLIEGLQVGEGSAISKAFDRAYTAEVLAEPFDFGD